MTDQGDGNLSGRDECLVIIGDGASAAILLSTLARQPPDRLGRVVVIGEASSHGPGRAYRWDLSDARMNLPNYAVSIDGTTTSNFLNWLTDNRLSSGSGAKGPFDFSARRVFGRYLRYSHLLAVTTLREAGIDVKIRHDKGDRAERKGRTWVVYTKGGARYEAVRVVACLGTAPPSNPYVLEANPRYVADPYPLVEALPHVPSNATIGILGTGLASVDVYRTLVGRSHSGTVHAFSRHGRLPRVRNTHQVTRPVTVTPARVQQLINRGEIGRLEDVLALAQHELASRRISTARLEKWWYTRDPLKLLEEQLNDAAQDDSSLELVMNTIHPNVEKLWEVLDTSEKLRFARQWRTDFTAFMSPMPKDVAFLMRNGLREGRFIVHAGCRGVSVTDAGNRFIITSAHGETIVDYLINTLTPQSGTHLADSSASFLLEGLTTEGALKLSPFGGVHVAPETGEAAEGLYLLGHATTGTHLLTNSIVALNRQAENITRHIRKD